MFFYIYFSYDHQYRSISFSGIWSEVFRKIQHFNISYFIVARNCSNSGNYFYKFLYITYHKYSVWWKSTARQFFQNYILAMIPLGIKFIILTLFAVTFGSDFSFSYIDSLNKSSFSLLTNLLIDPFFWWSSILGCIALKESHKLSYMKSIMIISLLFLLGLPTVMLFNLIWIFMLDLKGGWENDTNI